MFGFLENLKENREKKKLVYHWFIILFYFIKILLLSWALDVTNVLKKKFVILNNFQLDPIFFFFYDFKSIHHFLEK